MCCAKPFGQHRSSPKKTYNLLTVGAGGRRGTETKNLNNTCPATKQNLSHLWASTKGNHLHPSQTQCRQGRLAGLPQMCSEQPLSGWFWTLDSQTSNSLQQPNCSLEQEGIPGHAYRPHDQIHNTAKIMDLKLYWNSAWHWKFPEKKNAPLNALFKRAWETGLKRMARS